MKKYIFLIFLFITNFYHSQNVSAKQDSLLKKTSSNPNFNNNPEALKKLSLSYISINDSIARHYAEKLYTVSLENNSELQKNESLFLIGQSYATTSTFKALDNFNKSSEYLININHSFLDDLYFEKARIYTTYSEFPKALELALQSYQHNKSKGLEKNIQRDLSHIGYIHDRMYEYRASLDWNKKSLVIAKKLNDTAAIAKCYGRIGIAYDELAEKDGFNKVLFDSALYFNEKAAYLSELSGDLGYARTTYSNIGNSYSKLKMYDKAEEYTLKSLNVPGFKANKGVTLVNLGKIYLETGRYKDAKIILDSALANTIKYGTRKYQFEAYYRFHELDVKQRNYKGALENYINYKSIEDSLLNETKNKQIIDTRERFQTVEKEKEIAQQKEELLQQKLEIKTKNLYSLLLVFGLLVLGLIAYFIYKKKQQLSKELELKDALATAQTQNRLQDQRLRISRDLHDNIGSQLTFIISSIDNLKFLAKSSDEKLKEKLSNINSFASNTISQLRDTIWAMNKNEITYEDFQGRTLALIEKAKLAKEDTQFNFNSNVKSNIVFTSVIGINIFRIVQEAINNSLKYADASQIDIDITELSDALNIRISDNGKGFNLNRVDLGNGLENMQRRIEEISSTLKIDSNIDKGTKISIVIPKSILDK